MGSVVAGRQFAHLVDHSLGETAFARIVKSVFDRFATVAAEAEDEDVRSYYHGQAEEVQEVMNLGYCEETNFVCLLSLIHSEIDPPVSLVPILADRRPDEPDLHDLYLYHTNAFLPPFPGVLSHGCTYKANAVHRHLLPAFVYKSARNSMLAFNGVRGIKLFEAALYQQSRTSERGDNAEEQQRRQCNIFNQESPVAAEAAVEIARRWTGITHAAQLEEVAVSHDEAANLAASAIYNAWAR